MSTLAPERGLISFSPHLPSLLISTLLALRGLRSTSLSTSGAIAALAFGYATLASPLRLFGVCLLGFYLAGSRATKVKAKVKATYEEPEHPSLPPSTPVSPSSTTTVSSPARDREQKVSGGGGGRRTSTQVACNALVGSICSILWRVLYSGEFNQTNSWDRGGEDGRWCVVERYGEGDRRRWSRVLVFTAVAFWSACCGDTFASELGILSRSPPILITRPFSGPVPRGTNGGITFWGLVVSFQGGLFVGTLATICLMIQGQKLSCGEGSEWVWELIQVAGLSGLGGSLLDSLLGALFQPTFYSPSRKLVVHHHETPSKRRDVDDKIVKIDGTAIFGPWLSNNGVNAVMGLATSLVVALYAYR
ncbi:hypothetical protein JCM16303_006787 [Sporobolomyces ruberrimus]